MKRFLIVVCVIALCACKVQKTGEDTYRIVAPTPQAKRAAERAKAEAAQEGQKIKEDAAKFAQTAGSKLQETGRNIEAHEPPAQSSETTQTTSTVETPNTETTTTERRTHGSRRH